MSSFVSVNGVTLHYQLDAKPKTVPVVFINSLGSDFRIWDEVVQNLGVSVLRYDKRGHGLSDVGVEACSIAKHAQDLLALLEVLNLERVVLVGISVGGQIALEFAARFPGRVAGAIFCDTGMKIGTAELWDARIEAVRLHGLAHISDGVMQRWFGSDYRQNQTARVRGFQNMLERTSPLGYINTCEALRDSDLHDAAQTILASRVPSLVICGSDDQSTPVALSQELAQALQTRLELIKGAGHLPCIEQPQRMAAMVQAFSVEPGGLA